MVHQFLNTIPHEAQWVIISIACFAGGSVFGVALYRALRR